MTQQDITLAINHINSTARGSLNGRTPFELASLLLDEKLLKLICEIYSDCEPHLQQGTVEAGIFCKNMPGISYVCIAPRYYNAHSPNEYFLISQSAKNVGQLRELLRRLK